LLLKLISLVVVVGKDILAMRSQTPIGNAIEEIVPGDVVPIAVARM